jgi:hypothetical protein
MNPNYNEASCAQIKPNANIDAELGELCNAVGGLQEIVEALEGRLRGVMIATVDMALKNGAGAPLEKAKSPLAQELSCRVSSIYAARERIANIMHNLDL